MHWVIQREVAFVWPVWASELTRIGASFTIVRVVPHTILTMPTVNPPGHVVCLGSAEGADDLSRVARARGWSPGMWTDNLDTRMWNEQLGSDMLNHGATVTTLDRVASLMREDMFIRPVTRSKAFNGGVLTMDAIRKHGADGWIERVFPRAPKDMAVSIAPVVAIDAEYRFFVVHGRLVTWSRYRRWPDARDWSGEVGAEAIDFAQSIVDRWGPDVAYVMDVAQCGGTWKVVEFNCLNSSALYGGDAGAVVAALEAGFGS